MDFAVDAQLLGNKVLCLLAMNVHGPGVSILDFQHNAAKLVAYMPSTSLYNDQWAYNSKTKVYYCEVGVNGTGTHLPLPPSVSACCVKCGCCGLLWC